MRELAIGDIHGCARSFETLLGVIQPQRTDTLILLGDFVDRGPESCRVIQMIIELNQQCTVIALTGNHEVMMRRVRADRTVMTDWLRHGGRETLLSYQKAGFPAGLGAIPDKHWQFLEEQTLDFWETEKRIFVHASLDPELSLGDQSDYQLFWQPFSDPMVHKSGKQIICGHTAQKSGRPAIFDGGVCIDTMAYGGGWLTCLNTVEKTAFQANERGERRILREFAPRPGDPR